jgi:hypothetical protein
LSHRLDDIDASVEEKPFAETTGNVQKKKKKEEPRSNKYIFTRSYNNYGRRRYT